MPVVPFGAVSLASGITTVILQTKRAIGTEVFPVGGFLSRLALTGADLAFYLGKTLWPENLLPMYPRWRVDPPDIWQFLPWPLCAALLFGCWTRRRTWGRAALLSLGFFLLNVLPVLGFFQMSYWRLAWASDHLVYQPSLGIIGLAAVSAGTVYDCLRGRWRAAAVSAGWAAVAGLVFSTHRYAEAYMNLDTLCEYTLASNPDAWLAHQISAHSYENRHDYQAALAACRLKPDVVETQNTLGTALELSGNLKRGHPGVPRGDPARTVCLAHSPESRAITRGHRPVRRGLPGIPLPA